MMSDSESIVTPDGTHYREGTRPNVIGVLQMVRTSRTRIRIWYGDNETGQSWGDYTDGYVSRSTGTVKIPIHVYNTRSLGGGAILTRCIVLIETTAGKQEIWRHPSFRPFICDYCGTEHAVRDACTPMSTHMALEIVYDLAVQGALELTQVDNELVVEAMKQQNALSVVHDFIVNNFWR
jgi:hypothetical protein